MNINQKDTYIWMYVWMNEREYVSILSTQWDTNQLNANFSYDLQNKKICYRIITMKATTHSEGR